MTEITLYRNPDFPRGIGVRVTIGGVIVDDFAWQGIRHLAEYKRRVCPTLKVKLS